MIELQHLSAGYPGCPVLQDISLTLPTGKITVIAGPNGCGKSTLLKAITGILPHSQGRILVDGEEISQYSSQKLAQKVAFLPQSKQVPDITALRMVLHGRFPYLSYPRRYRPQDFAIAREAMDRMGILEYQDRLMPQLSGGTQQKVYIAMALAQDTPTILMDEPTTYLDAARQLQLMEQARALAQDGKAVVMVLHDLTMALEAADQLAIVSNGRLIQVGDSEQVFSSGCLDDVFGIRVGRFAAEDGWQYYYRRKQV